MISNWFYIKNKEKVGPITDEEFVKLKMRGDIQDNTYVWKKGMANWTKLSEINNPQLPAQKAKKETQKIIINFQQDALFLLQDNKSPLFGPFDREKIATLAHSERIDQSCAIYSLNTREWHQATDFLDTPLVTTDNRDPISLELPNIIEFKVTSENKKSEMAAITTSDLEQLEIELLFPQEDVDLGKIVTINFKNKTSQMEINNSYKIKNKALLKRVA